VCVLLGPPRPVVLRPSSGGAYKVVGVIYVHGLDYAEGLLGTVPEPWKHKLGWTIKGSGYTQVFRNLRTGILTDGDPRLGELPQDWRKTQNWDPEDQQIPMFRNDKTGEETEFDPRLSVEELKKRGVPIRQFALV
jgi:hypothetical protein